MGRYERRRRVQWSGGALPKLNLNKDGEKSFMKTRYFPIVGAFLTFHVNARLRFSCNEAW
jgi:hypothetical protein